MIETTSTMVPVLIVGAGPTGLTLACELARAGVSFRLVEAAGGPQPGSRGKGVQPRTLEVFDDLGVVERVIAHGRMAMPIRSAAPDGRVTVSGGGTAVARPDVPYPASLITPEWRVEEALRVRLAELGGAVEFGTALGGFEQLEEGVAAVVVKGGATETINARWLVGCDGGHSVVRKQAGIAFDGETREEVRMIVADVEVDGLDRDAWHMWRHEEGLVTLCPLPSTGLFQYQAGIAPGQDPGLGLANMQAILERRSGRTDLRLHEPRWASLWRANVRLAARYRQGDVFLAGDAAHIHSPAGGQGMNTGIQDAHNLGWKLAAVAKGASPALLYSYEAERRPVGASVLALSDARLKQTLAQNGLVTRRDASTTQLGVSYRGSTLARDDREESAPVAADDRDRVALLRAANRDPGALPHADDRDKGALPHAGDRDGGSPLRTGDRDTGAALHGGDRVEGSPLRAGDRAPDAAGLMTVGGERRLFELTRGGHFTLLCFGAVPAVEAPPSGLRIFRVVGRPVGPGDVADAEGHLARAYGATGRTLVVIRPDGHVGLISDAGDVSAVSDYLALVS
ncbi:putative monooxygenase [[Actinomadura] parvosata subsp. kistnae]|uniref:FAD-dependent oxidoreductase n=1 Tax=[Actinomadura] parvosata TaxID=1955412 RepID=UPI000D28854F|nr:FAD-dependent oxidoreductase [Nonomuraea sp. ATCC 55076]SPL87834.1 putative monooxygenase [Actinomadura parvosata subsp. kistnae]